MPIDIAAFQTEAPAPGQPIAVAGFPYPEAMSAPVVTFGALSALTGLDDAPDRARLALRARAGDAGGPVLDATGAVVGVLLPAPDPAAAALPADLAEAAQTAPLAPILAAQGFAPVAAEATAPLSDAALSRIAAAITGRVACWN